MIRKKSDRMASSLRALTVQRPMRAQIVCVAAASFLVGCANLRLSDEQRAHIYCQEAGGSGNCVRETVFAWQSLASTCQRKDPVADLCVLEFERLYGCREITTTGATGTSTSTAGPTCGMGPVSKSELKESFVNICVGERFPNDANEVAGARCSCGAYLGCLMSYPIYSEALIKSYFPSP